MPRPNPQAMWEQPIAAHYLNGSQFYAGQYSTVTEVVGNTYLTGNAYHDGTNWRYITAGVAGAMGVSLFWVPTVLYAPSGAADATITWTDVTPGRVLASAYQTATATTGVTTTETVITGCSDITVNATGAHRYRVIVRVRASNTTADADIVFRVRDGGGSAPTNTSTLLADWQVPTPVASRVYDYSLTWTTPLTTTLSAGAHHIGLFVARGAGAAGTVATNVSSTAPTFVEVSVV